MILALLVAGLVAAVPAGAAQTRTTRTITRPSRTITITRPSITKTIVQSSAATPVLVTELDKPPKGYRLTARQVLKIARANAHVKAELKVHPKAIPYEYTKGPDQWQVSWFSHTKPQRELLQVYITDSDGQVSQAWSGFQVAWSMARGYPGAFGRKVNDWLSVAAALRPVRRAVHPMAPAADAAASRSPDAARLLDLAGVLQSRRHRRLDAGVYPFLLYLLARMTLLAFGKGVPREPLRTIVPVPWLGIGIIFLLAFRIGLNVMNSNVIDVGYAGVIGADKLVHGVALYGHWPKDNMYGDTYGTVSYALYVPFRLIFGWSGTWDSLPAAHGAAIFFDLLTMAGLFLLGRRIRDTNLGTLLVYAWVSYPFTLYAMNSNTNDSLVAAAVVFCLLVITSAPGRGVLGALAGLTKFAPFVLAPLLMRGTGERPRERSLAAYIIAFALTIVVCMLPVLLNHDLEPFWKDSIVYQSGRTSPFSIWGLWGRLGAVQHLLQGAVVAAAIGVYFVPGRRTVVEVAALAAGLIIALQLTVNYWLYPYIVWFFPLVIVALFASHPAADAPSRASWDPLAHDRDEPIPIQIATP